MNTFLNLCKKVSLARDEYSNYMSSDKLRMIMKAFIESQFGYCPLIWILSPYMDTVPLFGYCPLIWMFHSRTLNNRINMLHERALRLVYKNSTLV